MTVTITKRVEIDTNKAIINMRKSLRESYQIPETDDEILLQILEDMTAKVRQCVEFKKQNARR